MPETKVINPANVPSDRLRDAIGRVVIVCRAALDYVEELCAEGGATVECEAEAMINLADIAHSLSEVIGRLERSADREETNHP